MSKRTVESHLVSIYAKLGVGSKTELIRRAARVRDLSEVPYLYGGIARRPATFADSSCGVMPATPSERRPIAVSGTHGQE